MIIKFNLILVMCVLRGVFNFLFLCDLDGKCMPFIVWVTYQKLPNKYK